ncbi:MAG: MFS transporter [Eubacterium sp.]|nr:MFS transporter [Eubacterium sp.]
MKQVFSNNDTKSNFGKNGWLMVLLAGMGFWFVTGITVDGLNVILPAMAEQSGMDYNTLLSWSTPAAWLSIPGSVLIAILCNKKGIKFTAISTLIVTAIAFSLYGYANTFATYLIFAGIVNFASVGFSHVGANALMASWFPRKKGLALGWATIGQNLSTALFVPLITFMIAHYGCGLGMSSISVMMVAFAAVLAFLMKNTPEECGCTPDNDNLTRAQIDELQADFKNYKSPFTIGKLLRMKEVWMIGVAFGALYMVTVGLISQMVPRLIELGYAQTTAITMMTVAAFIGCFGSYCWGYLDQLITTRKASIVYAFWYIGALILQIIPSNTITIMLSIFMIGFGIGGIGNLVSSIVATKFGRYDFIKAWGVILPITAVIRCSAYAVLAFGLSHLGGYAGAYSIFLAINIVAVILIWRLDDTCIGKTLDYELPEDEEEDDIPGDLVVESHSL